MQRTLTTTTFVIGCLLASTGMLLADDTSSPDKLPEPALLFAKEANLRVLEIERDVQTLSESLKKARPGLLPPIRRHSDDSLRMEATQTLSAAKNLLQVENDLPSTLRKFRDALAKSTTHYRAVAELYRAHADTAKTSEIKADYRDLARLYDEKAMAASKRAERLSTTTATTAASELVAEGNVLVERLLESLGVGPATDSERELFLGRLRRHGERCQSLSDELVRVMERVLGDSSTAAPRHDSTPSPLRSPVSSSTQKDPRAIVGVTWTSPVTIRGVEYRQRIRLNADGTATQSIYRAQASGFGPLLAQRSFSYQLDPSGNFAIFSGGKVLETAKVRDVGEESWVYDIIENVADPSMSAKRITFVRDSTRLAK